MWVYMQDWSIADNCIYVGINTRIVIADNCIYVGINTRLAYS